MTLLTYNCGQVPSAGQTAWRLIRCPGATGAGELGADGDADRLLRLESRHTNDALISCSTVVQRHDRTEISPRLAVILQCLVQRTHSLPLPPFISLLLVLVHSRCRGPFLSKHLEVRLKRRPADHDGRKAEASSPPVALEAAQALEHPAGIPGLIDKSPPASSLGCRVPKQDG